MFTTMSMKTTVAPVRRISIPRFLIITSLCRFTVVLFVAHTSVRRAFYESKNEIK